MIYDASFIGTSTNRITFNGSSSPIFRVRSQAPQARQVRELDIPVPFESGISDFETLLGKVIYPIDGTMYVSVGSESNYDSGRRSLRKLSSLEISQGDNLSDMGYVPFAWTDFSGMKQVFVKVLYVQMTEDTRKGLVQPFRLFCKVKDPTIHGTTLKTADTSSSDPTTASGTAIYPFAYPIIYGASTYSVSSTVTNDGDLDAYPQSIVVRGPVNSPIITNETTGEFIQVNVNLATSSNFLRIFYDKDSLSVEKDGDSVINEVTSTSTYFKIQPGGNEISLSGSSIGSGAYVQLSIYDSWSLS